MTGKWRLVGTAVLASLGATLSWLWPGRDGEAVLRLPGVVEIQEVRLGSKVGGRVAEICVVEGQLVEPGQPLVRLEVPELEAKLDQARARLAAAEAALAKATNGPRRQELDAARAAAAAARAQYDLVKAGPRAEEIRQARAELAAAEADLEIVREEYERVARLFGMSTSSRAEYDTALFAYNRARGRAESARARLDMDLAGSRPQQIAQAAAELARAEANLDLLRAGTRPEDLAAAAAAAEELRGQVREIEANLRERAVGAPDRAVVEVLAVRPGDLVAPNAPVARILRARDLWVKVYVPETELGKVRLNQPAEVTVDAYPGRRLAGRVRQIASIAEFTPRNVQSLEGRRSQVFGVKVYVRDPEGIFKSGMAAEVSLPLAPSRGSARR